MAEPLREFQRENVEWIQRVGRGLLADEPGLGKSRSALEGFAGASDVLIIAPNLVANSGVWHEQVGLWGSDDTRYVLGTFSDLNDRKKTGKGTGTKPLKRLRPKYKQHWDAVIVDEAHYVKNRNNAWTWGTKQIAKQSDELLLLTGTPIPNWAHEVFVLLQLIYPHESKPGGKYGSFWRWAEHWFDCSPTRFSNGNPVVGELLDCAPACLDRNADDPCNHYLRFAQHNFGDRYMRHLRDDHLDIPPLNIRDVPSPLDAVAKHAYRQLRDKFSTEVSGHEVLAWSQGAKNIMMDKMTTSPWLLTKEGEPRGGKFELLREDLVRRPEPTLVLAHYRDTVEACARIAASAGARATYVHGGRSDKQNGDSVRQFRAGKFDVLVGSLETLAEGLQLTIARRAIFVERSYKPSRNTQATYRIHRMGQDSECFVTRYITPNSVDSRKEELLLTKTDRQMRALTAADLMA